MLYMKTKQPNRSQNLTRFSAIASAVAQLLVAGLAGGLCLVLIGKDSREAIVSASLLALSVVVAITWQQSRADARRRFLAALDAYAVREINQSRPRKDDE